MSSARQNLLDEVCDAGLLAWLLVFIVCFCIRAANYPSERWTWTWVAFTLLIAAKRIFEQAWRTHRWRTMRGV